MPGRDDLAHFVHLSDQLGVVTCFGKLRPIRQVHRALARQPLVHLLRQKRQKRRYDLRHVDEHRVKRVESPLILVPETVARSADVPIRQHVDVIANALARRRYVEGVKVFAHGVGEPLRMRQNVPVLHVERGEGLRVGKVDALGEIALAAVGRPGIEGEEVVGVPQRKKHLPHGVADRGLLDHKIAPSHHGRAHEEPAHGVGAVPGEDLGDVRVVAKRLRHLPPVVAQDDAVRDAVAESRPVEKRRGEDVEGVEPAAGLPDVLDDEVAGVVVVEPLPVFERIMHLGEGH